MFCRGLPGSVLARVTAEAKARSINATSVAVATSSVHALPVRGGDASIDVKNVPLSDCCCSVSRRW